MNPQRRSSFVLEIASILYQKLKGFTKPIKKGERNEG